MSIFGSLMSDVEDDPFFGSHMRHMRQMNSMMNSLFSDPFGMLGGGPLAIAGPRHSTAMMPFMPQMPSLNRLYSVDLTDGSMSAGSSYSSNTVFMSSGPNGKPQVISSSSSTKIGPNGVKETRKTLQDSRTGTKKMSIGHHIGERSHVIEREQNVYSGDAEERQEFINLDEEEAEDFDREFHVMSGAHRSRGREAIMPREAPRLALPAPPLSALAALPALPPAPASASSASATIRSRGSSSEARVSSRSRLSARRPIRTSASPLTIPLSSVRDVYGAAHPQRHRHKHHKSRHSPPQH